jgi:hypothetical protein
MDTQSQNKMQDRTTIRFSFTDDNGPLAKDEQSGYRIYKKQGGDPVPGGVAGPEHEQYIFRSQDQSGSPTGIGTNINIEDTDVDAGKAYFYRVEYYRDSTSEVAMSELIGPLQGYTSDVLAYPGGVLDYDPNDNLDWGDSYVSVSPIFHIDAAYEFGKHGGEYHYAKTYNPNPSEPYGYFQYAHVGTKYNIKPGKQEDFFTNLVKDINLEISAGHSVLTNWQSPINGDGIPTIVTPCGLSNGLGILPSNSSKSHKPNILKGFYEKYFSDKPLAKINQRPYNTSQTAPVSGTILLDKGWTFAMVIPGMRPMTRHDEYIDPTKDFEIGSHTFGHSPLWTQEKQNSGAFISSTQVRDEIQVPLDGDNESIGRYAYFKSLVNQPTTRPGDLTAEWSFVRYYDSILPNVSSSSFFSFGFLESSGASGITDSRLAGIGQYLYNFSDGNIGSFRKNNFFGFIPLTTGTLSSDSIFSGDSSTGLLSTRDEWKNLELQADGSAGPNSNIFGYPWKLTSFSYLNDGYYKDLVYKTQDDIDRYSIYSDVIGANTNTYIVGGSGGITTTHKPSGYQFPDSLTVRSMHGGVILGNIDNRYWSFHPKTTSHDAHEEQDYDGHVAYPLLTHDQFSPNITQWTHYDTAFKRTSLNNDINQEWSELAAQNKPYYHHYYAPENFEDGWKGSFPSTCGTVLPAMPHITKFYSDYSPIHATDRKLYIRKIMDDVPSVRNHEAYKMCHSSHILTGVMRVNDSEDGGPNQLTIFLDGEPIYNMYDFYDVVVGRTYYNNHSIDAEWAFGYRGVTLLSNRYGSTVDPDYDIRNKLYSTPSAPLYNPVIPYTNWPATQYTAQMALGLKPLCYRFLYQFSSHNFKAFLPSPLGFSEVLFFPEMLGWSDFQRMINYFKTKYTGKLYEQKDLYHTGYVFQSDWGNGTNDELLYGTTSKPYALDKFQQTHSIQTDHSPGLSPSFDSGPTSVTIGGWNTKYSDYSLPPFHFKHRWHNPIENPRDYYYFPDR